MIPDPETFKREQAEALDRYVSAEELARLALNITAGDVMAANRDADGDPARATILIVNRAGARLGLGDDVIDRLSMAQMTWVSARMAGDVDPTPASSTGSPISAATGA